MPWATRDSWRPPASNRPPPWSAPPGDTASEFQQKVEQWLQAGARAVWVVYPGGPRLMLHRPDGTARTLGPEDTVDGGEALPGFGMRLRDLLEPYGP